MKCKFCGTIFSEKDFKVAQDKMLVKIIKDTFYYKAGTLMRRTKSLDDKVVVANCGQITLPGGRRVQSSWVVCVLAHGHLPSRPPKKKS
jgi:hypothetical protein